MGRIGMEKQNRVQKEDIPESDEGKGGVGQRQPKRVTFIKCWSFVRHCPKRFRCTNSFDPAYTPHDKGNHWR